MLDTPLIQRVMDSSLRINEDLAYGLAVKQSEDIEEYIDAVIQCASDSFPPGLRYTGCRQATPQERLSDLTRLRRKRRCHELAKSDFYHCRYSFEYTEKGKTVTLKPRYIQLPYIRQGGIVSVHGSSFVVSPVISDNIFSINKNSVYMPVTRSKLTFFKERYTFLTDGEVTSVDCVYAGIFNIKKAKKHSKRNSLLVHYILAKYGLQDGLKRHFGMDVVAGTTSTITTKQYPQDKWVICSSRGVAPPARGATQYTPTDVVFAVPRAQWNHGSENVMGSIFYIVDNEPEILGHSDMVHHSVWRRTLPRFIKREIELEKKAIEEMEAHIASLDNYIDDLVRMKLQRENVPSDTIYDVFAYMVINFGQMTMESAPASMLNKQLETTRFLLFDIVARIFTLMFELVKLKGDRLTPRSIEQTFDRLFPTYTIEAIKYRHGEVTVLNSATDSLPLAVSRSIAPQSRVTCVGKRQKHSETKDPTFALDSSQIMVATYLFITKSEPSARTAVNHFLKLTETGQIIPEDAYIEELKVLNELFHI